MMSIETQHYLCDELRWQYCGRWRSRIAAIAIIDRETSQKLAPDARYLLHRNCWLLLLLLSYQYVYSRSRCCTQAHSFAITASALLQAHQNVFLQMLAKGVAAMLVVLPIECGGL
jgi:hypothetical protein